MADYADAAARCGNLVAAGDFAGAHSLLTKKAQAAHSPTDLERQVELMTAYQPGAILKVQVVLEGILLDWPSKEPEDLASVYVSLEGKGFIEAVTVIVAKEEGRLMIRDIEWGRP